MQIGELGLEQVVKIGVAGDVTRTAAAGAERAYGLNHRIEHDRVLAHPEIVVRAPHRHLASDAVIEGAGKKAATPLEMGEGAVAPFRAKLIKTLSEEAFVIHLAASFFFTSALSTIGTGLGLSKLGAVWVQVFPGPAVVFTAFAVSPRPRVKRLLRPLSDRRLPGDAGIHLGSFRWRYERLW